MDIKADFRKDFTPIAKSNTTRKVEPIEKTKSVDNEIKEKNIYYTPGEICDTIC